MKTHTIILFLAGILFTQIPLSAQSFDTQMDAIISNSKNSFIDLKGEPQESMNGVELFACTLPLDGFDLSLVTDEYGYMVYGVAYDNGLANLNLAMMTMLPPAAFTVHDSSNDDTLELPEGAFRQVTYVSRDKRTIINTVFFTDESIYLTITYQAG